MSDMSVFDELLLNLYKIKFALNFHNSESSHVFFGIGLHDPPPPSLPLTVLGSKVKWSLDFFFPPTLGRVMLVGKMLMLSSISVLLFSWMAMHQNIKHFETR